jgi:hypothetical protein
MKFALATQPSEDEDPGLTGISSRRGNPKGFFERSSFPVKKALGKSHDDVGASMKAAAGAQNARAQFWMDVGSNFISALAPLALPNAAMLIPKVHLRKDQVKMGSTPSKLVPARTPDSIEAKKHPDDQVGKIRLQQATVFGGPGSPFGYGWQHKQQPQHRRDTGETPHEVRISPRKRRDPDGPYPT